MGFIYIILGTLMWSVDTLVRYPLLNFMQADTIVFIEHCFLVLYLVPLLFINKFQFHRLNTRALFSFFIIGVIGSAVSTLAFTKAFTLINPSLVILLQKLQPLVAISLSALILKEKINPKFYIYAPLAFIGAFLVSYPDIAPLFQNTENTGVVIGYVLTLLAVVGWGASTVFGKALARQEFNETEIMTGRFVFGFLFLSAYSTSFGALPTTSITIEIYLKILVMVLLSGLFGMYLYYKGLKLISAHSSAIAELFFPLTAVVINWVFLNKTLSAVQIFGGALLIVASVLLQRQPKN
ncbi:MAG: DMT family transporter [Pseudobdellovibrio sp.]